jgi:hypothetical protein
MKLGLGRRDYKLFGKFVSPPPINPRWGLLSHLAYSLSELQWRPWRLSHLAYRVP